MMFIISEDLKDSSWCIGSTVNRAESENIIVCGGNMNKDEPSGVKRRTSESIPIKPLNAGFKFLSELGSGSFGTVSLYKMKDGLLDSLLKEQIEKKSTLLEPLSIYYRYSNQLVAIKTMNKKLKNIEDYSMVKELKFIFAIKSHFNLVQIIDVFIDKTTLKLNIVMENMDQNLYQLMKLRKGNVFSAKTLRSILSQLLSAILHIHKHFYYHRDVKPENILVMQNLNYFGSRQNIPPEQRQHSYIIKLADYGLARHAKNIKPFTAYVSTRWYRSPEILLRQGFYSYPVDIWAFGCVAVECATFYPLFPGTNEIDQCCKIMEFLGNPDKAFQLSVLQNSNFHNITNYNYNYNCNSFVPFGGFWEEARFLAVKLGLKFPKTFGKSLENVIQRNDFHLQEQTNFFNMVKSCLTWDPKQRISSFGLSKCRYFKDSLIDFEYQKENQDFLSHGHMSKVSNNSTAVSKTTGDNNPDAFQNNANATKSLHLFQKSNQPLNASTKTAGKPHIDVKSDIGITNKHGLLSRYTKLNADKNSSGSKELNINFQSALATKTETFSSKMRYDDQYETGKENNSTSNKTEEFPETDERISENDEDEIEKDNLVDTEDEEKILSRELNRIANFFSNPLTSFKDHGYSDISIRSNNPEQSGNYDLIDELDFDLTDEIVINNKDLYGWSNNIDD